MAITIKEIHVKTTIGQTTGSTVPDEAWMRKITNEVYQKLKEDMQIETRKRRGR